MVSARVIAAVLLGCLAAMATVLSASPRPAAASGLHFAIETARAPLRPDKADWLRIKNAARLRSMALERNRTARFRSFAASLGLSELDSIHPLAPGRCLTAVIDLHNNLLDLQEAIPGERWNPLRRAVAKEPSIRACAPRRSTGSVPE